MIISLFISILVLLLGAYAVRDYPEEMSFVDQWYFIYTESFFVQMLPLIVTLPFADSLSSDRKLGYFDRALMRTRYKPLLRSKGIANALAGGAAGALPLALLYLLVSLINKNPINHPALTVVFGRPYESQFLVDLYTTMPDLFILVVILAVFVMGALFASLGMAVTLLVNHRLVALSFPFLLANGLQYFANNARLLPWFLAPSEPLLKPNFSQSHAFETVNEIPYLLILPALLLGGTLLLYLLLGSRQQVLENSRNKGNHQSLFNRVSNGLEEKIPKGLRSFPIPEKRLGRGTPTGNYFFTQFKLAVSPFIMILIALVMAVLSIVMLGWMKRQVPHVFNGSGGLPPNTWDLFFRTYGDPLAMSLVIANLYLILASGLQPQTAFGHLAIKRLGSRTRSWRSHVLFLLLLSAFYVLFCFAVIMLTGQLLGLRFSTQWSVLCSPEHTNLPSFFCNEGNPWMAFLTVFAMTTLGFFSLGLLVLLINTLTQRRLIGYFIVEVLLVASMPLASIFLNAPPALQYLPIIRNLVLRFYPFIFRDLNQTWASIYQWGIWIAILLPLTWLAYRKQNYFSQPDLE
ncbi:MAG TPA: hypothetical protein DD636_09090 [Anaerolineaceae bacterium]|nr:hypothetical protein [Anaerolineaceae bacterium]